MMIVLFIALTTSVAAQPLPKCDINDIIPSVTYYPEKGPAEPMEALLTIRREGFGIIYNSVKYGVRSVLVNNQDVDFYKLTFTENANKGSVPLHYSMNGSVIIDGTFAVTNNHFFCYAFYTTWVYSTNIPVYTCQSGCNATKYFSADLVNSTSLLFYSYRKSFAMADETFDFYLEPQLRVQPPAYKCYSFNYSLSRNDNFNMKPKWDAQSTLQTCDPGQRCAFRTSYRDGLYRHHYYVFGCETENVLLDYGCQQGCSKESADNSVWECSQCCNGDECNNYEAMSKYYKEYSSADAVKASLGRLTLAVLIFALHFSKLFQ